MKIGSLNKAGCGFVKHYDSHHLKVAKEILEKDS